MPPRNSTRLAAPLKKFRVPVVKWRPSVAQFEDYESNKRVTYEPPQEVSIFGKVWYILKPRDAKRVRMGNVLLPPKYYPLWRRLVYGALFQENMLKAWIERTGDLRGRSLNAEEEEMVNLRNMAGVRLVQYLLYR
jgi:hypothetical protein